MIIDPHLRQNTIPGVKAQRASIQREPRFLDLIENACGWIWEMDASFHYVYASPKVAEVLGYSPQELAGRSPFDLMPALEALRMREEFEALLLNPHPYQSRDMINLHKDGTVRMIESSAVPVLDSQGRFTGLRGIDRDVTERKKTDQALRESLARAAQQQARSEAIVAAIGEGLIIVDRKFKVIFRNHVIKGFAKDDDQHCYSLICNQPTLCDDCPMSRTFQDGKIHTAEKMVLKNGVPVYREVTTSPLRDESGNIVAGVELVRDITQRKLDEERIRSLNEDLSGRAAQLEAANKDLEAYSYTVSHDLRGPLTNISSYCQAILELNGERLDQQCQGFMKNALEEVHEMDTLITSLLNLSRFSHIRIKSRRVDLSAVARVAAAQLQIREPERQARFEIEDGVVAAGDERLLKLVIDNLLGNAWKFCSHREETVISFGMTQSQGRTIYYVSDNGIGFKKSQSKLIFEVFQRLHRNQQKFEGFGIGLATVQRVIARHHGRIWAEGEPGKGARFCFTLHEKQ